MKTFSGSALEFSSHSHCLNSNQSFNQLSHKMSWPHQIFFTAKSFSCKLILEQALIRRIDSEVNNQQTHGLSLPQTRFRPKTRDKYYTTHRHSQRRKNILRFHTLFSYNLQKNMGIIIRHTMFIVPLRSFFFFLSKN